MTTDERIRHVRDIAQNINLFYKDRLTKSKFEYNKVRHAKKYYGEFWESSMILNRIKKEIIN